MMITLPLFGRRCIGWFFVCCGLTIYAHAAVLQAMHVSIVAEGQVQLHLQLDRAITAKQVQSFAVKQPPRIVVDLFGVKNAIQPLRQRLDRGPLKDIRLVATEDRTRLLVDLRHLAAHRVVPTATGIDIIFSQAQLLRTPAAELLRRRIPKHAIQRIDFRKDGQHGGQIIAVLADEKTSVDVKMVGGQLLAQFADTQVAPRWQREYDVQDFSTPVKTFTVRQEGADAVIRVAATANYEHLAYQIDKRFIIDIKPIDEQSALLDRLKKPRYKGKRLSLNFQDIQVRAVLQLLAEFTGINVVISDAVTGSMSLRLSNVAWDQALDIILKTRGLDKRQVGNVMLIDRAADLATREREELQSLQDISNLEPVRTELMQLNYAIASDVADLLSPKAGSASLLSKSGTISVDQRTNTLIVQEIPIKLREIRDLIARIDIPVRQVLIEARVVNVEKNREEDLGVRFGITRADTLSGTLDGANTIQSGTAPAATTLANRLNFDFAAASTAGKIGLALARLGNDVLLDLELSALEVEGDAEIISSPKLITSDQQAAHILTGEEIPYLTSSSSGATTVAFRDAELRLDVTPHITPDNNILLTLQVNNDSRGEQTLTNGPPAIDTDEVKTQVLVNNGQTVVLGGVYKKTNRNDLQRVPFFGSLPVIGHLFRHNKVITNRTELLVFVTPKIVQSKMFAR